MFGGSSSQIIDLIKGKFWQNKQKIDFYDRNFVVKSEISFSVPLNNPTLY